MRGLVILCGLFGFVGTVVTAGEVEYAREIRPLLDEKCGACHGALKQEAGLRLDAGTLIRRGSDEGAVVLPGRAAGSRLIQRVTADDVFERMPPEGEGEPLTASQVGLLTRWIDEGAVVPEDEPIPVDPRQHWAYQAPQRPALPEAVAAEWAHPIDAFVFAKHRARGLTAVGVADRYTLLRRLYFDLIGLSPTRRQIQEYVDDESPAAWEKVVDGLLASPQYGERWGRHWMDVWRYSDWDGFKQELRGSQRHIWHWRDWIVRSLNDDLGYDRMVMAMLAGDELAPDDRSMLAATGFLARNYNARNRNLWLEDTVEHTAKAFLGLTIDCARCHDHKYDPIQQTAYYEFRAIFEPYAVRTDRLPQQPDVMQDGLPRVFDGDLAAETFLFQQGNDKQPDTEHPMAPAVPDALGGRLDIQPVSLPVTAYYPSIREFVIDEDLAAARRQVEMLDEQTVSVSNKVDERSIGMEELHEEIGQLKKSVAECHLRALEARVASERAVFGPHVDATSEQQKQQLAESAAERDRQLNLERARLAVLERQDALHAAEAGDLKNEKKRDAKIAAASKALKAAEQKLVQAEEAMGDANDEYEPLGERYPPTSSGRRLALARWIGLRENPLTARVAVNQMWMRHFGAPLVENVFDFGLRSPRPEHADLLDWLAVELMESDWSMKHVHRLMVTSRTWRLSSSSEGPVASQNEAIDLDNRLLWRSHTRRLEAEGVRDAVLAVSGELDRTLGGPEIDFHEGESSPRRSLYFRQAYEKQMTMLVLFDAASPNECYRRSESIVPQQALALSNSSLSLSTSRRLARRLWEEVSRESNEQASSEFIRFAFLQILNRPPEVVEIGICLRFLQDQAERLNEAATLTQYSGGPAPSVEPAADPHARARENLVHVLMNHNDFVTLR